MVVEIYASYLTRSLALLTDALDLLKDCAEFTINIIALGYTKKKSNERYTFGYLKAESLGAFVSIILIWVFYGLLLIESIIHIATRDYDVKSGLML